MPTPRLYANPAARQAAYRQRRVEARSKELAAKGLPALPRVANIPGSARWEGLVQQASLLLQAVHDEMEAYYDQRSETWRESEQGTTFLDRLQAVHDAREALEDLPR
jgi:hypothetical protein